MTIIPDLVIIFIMRNAHSSSDVGEIAYRRMKSRDGEAVARLAAGSPDTGMVAFTLLYNIDPYRVFHELEEAHGTVAESIGGSTLVGAIYSRLGKFNYEGELRPFALVSSLLVHPDYRCGGIASGLLANEMEAVRSQIGPEGVAIANIQKGNVGSQRSAGKVFSQTFGKAYAIPFPVSSKPPAPMPGVTIRKAEAAEFEEIAEKLNAFYQGYNFFSPETGRGLEQWCGKSYFPNPFRHYYVAVDKPGNILAGMALIEGYRFRTFKVFHMPGIMRLLNKVIKLVPPNGLFLEAELDKIWHAPGQAAAARYLFRTLRWQWREKADALVVYIDPAGPLAKVFKPRPWTLKTEFNVVLEAPVPPSNRLMCPITE